MEFGVWIAHYLVGNNDPIPGSVSFTRTLFLAEAGGSITNTFIGSDFVEFPKKRHTLGEHKMLMTKFRI